MKQKVMISNFRIFMWLMWRDILVLKKDFFGDLINLVSWPIALVVTFGFVLPSFGMLENYGSFLLIGALGTAYFYLAVAMASQLVSDFEGERFIESQCIIPVTSYKVILMQRVTSFALHSFTLSVPLLPVGKMLLGPRLSLEHFSFCKFMIAMITAAFFFGFFALALASWFESTRSISNIWRRIYTPMMLFGCYWFSFAMALKEFPRAAYSALFNPLTFIIESIRSSVFGPAEYLPYWPSQAILILCTLVLAHYSFIRIKERLDLL